MKKKAVIRNIIIIVVVIIVGGVGYKLFFSGSGSAAPSDGSGLATTAGAGSSTDTSGTSGVSTDTDPTAGADLLTTLLNVKSITLDNSIFSNQAFTLLQDFNQPIPPDTNPGRPNPFAPLGSDSTAISTQVSTSNPSAVTATTSTLNGSLTLDDPSVMRWFAYGTTASLGQTTPQKSQPTPGAFADTITGLAPNTAYYAQADASIGGQTILGNVVTWKTALSASAPAKK